MTEINTSQASYNMRTKINSCNFTDSTVSELFYKDVTNIAQLILFLKTRLQEFPSVTKNV